MRRIGLEQCEQIEVFPDFDELALMELADQYDRQDERCSRCDLVRRRRPLVSNNPLVYVLPTEFRAFRIAIDVEGEKSIARRVIPCGN
jgi:hypothetical protein